MSDIDTTQSPSSVFYGYFSKYTWRNEKNGNSFFRIVTKQELFFEQQYCKKEVKKKRGVYKRISVMSIKKGDLHKL